MGRVIANLDMYTPLSDIAEAARVAESIGFDCLSIPDACHDGLTAAAIAASVTSDIEIANSALVCFPRSPMTTAVAVWDVQELSRGRYRLGLGPLIAPNIVQKYSTPWYPPAPRMREYVESMSAIFNSWQYSEELNYQGKYYQFTRQQAYAAPMPIEHPDIPIQLAAVGPNMMSLAGELADAVSLHPTNTSAEFIRTTALPELKSGATKVGRATSNIEIIVNPFLAVGDTRQELQESRNVSRRLLAIVLSTPNYWRSLELIDRADIGLQLKELYRNKQIDLMVKLIDDEIMDMFVLSTMWDELPERLKEAYPSLSVSFGVNFDPSNKVTNHLVRLVRELKE